MCVVVGAEGRVKGLLALVEGGGARDGNGAAGQHACPHQRSPKSRQSQLGQRGAQNLQSERCRQAHQRVDGKQESEI